MSPTEVGTAYVVIRALTRDVKKDIQKGFQDGLKDNKTLFAKYGKEAGDEFNTNFSKRISESVEKSLNRGTGSTGNSGMTAGKAFGRSFAKEAETRMLEGHKSTGRKKTRESAGEGENAGREFGRSFARESQKEISRRTISGPTVNTSSADRRIRAIRASALTSASFNINADVSGASSSISTLVSSLGTLAKASALPVLTSALNGVSFSALSVVQSLGQVTNTIALLPGMIGGLLPVIGSAMLAFNGMGEAFGLSLSDAPEDVEKLNEALKKLAPSAQNFVKEFASLKEPFVDMKKNIQQEFFEPLDGSLRKLAENTLPMLNTSLANVSRETGGLLRSIMDSVGETNNVSLFGKLFDNTAEGLQSLQRGMQPTVSAMLRLMEASSRFLPRMGDGWHNVMSTFDGFMARVASDGTFEAYVNRGIEASKQWGRIFGDLGVTIGNVWKAAAPTTQAFIDMIERGTESMRAISGSFEGQNTMKSFFESGLRSVHTWNEVFQDLGTILRDVLPIMQNWADIIMPVFTSLTGLLADNAKLVGNLLVGFMAFKSIQGLVNGATHGLGSFTNGMRRLSDMTLLTRGGLSGFKQDMQLQGTLAANAGKDVGKFSQALAVVESRSETFGEAAKTARTTVQPAMAGIRQSAVIASTAFKGNLTPAISGFRTAARNIGPAVNSVVVPALNGLRTSATNVTTSLRSAGDALARFASPATSRLGAAGSAMSNAVSSATSRLVGGAASNVTSMVAATRNAISTLSSDIRGRLTPAMNGMRTSASSAWSTIATSAQASATAMKRHVASIRGDVSLLSRYGATVARDAATTASSTVRNVGRGISQSIRNTVTPAFDSIRSTASNAANSIRSTLTPAFSAIQSSAETASAGMSRTFSPALNGLRTGISNVSTAMSKTLSPAFAGMQQSMQSASQSLNRTLVPALAGARIATTNFAAGIAATSSAAMTGFTRGVSGMVGALGGPFGVAILAATIAFTNYKAGAQRGKQASDDFANAQINLSAATDTFRTSLILASDTSEYEAALSSYTSVVDESVNSLVRYAEAAPSFMQKSAAGWDFIGDAIGVTDGLTLDFVNTQHQLSESGKITQSTLSDMGMTTGDLTRALINGSPQYDLFANKLAATGPAGADAAAELDRTRLMIESLEYAAANATELDKYSAAMDVLADKTSGAAEKLNAFKTALDIATGADLDQLKMDAENVEQIGETVEALGKVTSATGEYTGTLDVNNEAHRNLIDVMDDQRDTLGNTLLAMDQQGASHEEMTAKVAASKQSFIDQAIAMGQSETAAQTLADQIFGIPEQTAASVYTPGLAEAIQKFKELDIAITITPDGKHLQVTDNTPETRDRLHAMGIEFVESPDKKHLHITENIDDVLPKIASVTDAVNKVPTHRDVYFNAIKTGDWSAAGNIDPATAPGYDPKTGPSIPGLAPRALGAINKWVFADGGTRLPIEAKIQPSVGTQGLIQWAEASTHGEAFIPLNPAKKARSSAIWLETGKKLGLIKSNADGSVPSGAAAAIAVRNLDVEILAAIKEGFAKTLSALTHLRGGSIAAAGAGPSTGAPAASTTSGTAAGGVVNELTGAAELGAAPAAVSTAGSAISDTISNVVNPAMSSLDQQLMTSKTGVIDPTFQGIAGGMTDLGMTVPSVTSSMINPAIAGMGTNLMSVGQGMINPALASVQNAMTNTGNVFGLITQGAINPMWNDTANTILGGYQGSIDPAFQGIMGGLGHVSNSFGQGASNIATQWDRVREATASPVRFAVNTVFNNGLIGMWNSVSDLLGTTRMNPYPLNFATGGTVPMMPGASPNADSIPAMLMPKEFVVSKPMLKAIGAGNIDRGIGMLESVRQRAGRIKDQGPAGLFQNVKGYAGGGVVQGDDTWKRFAKAHMFAKQHDGKPYVWGGSIGPDGGTDCSGWVSSVADVVHGGNGLTRKWATGSFPGGGGSQGATGPQGFVQGLAAGLSAGVSTVHTAGTLGGVPGLPTVNIESGGGHGRVAYGGPAVGADNGQFPSRYHLAMAGLGKFMGGGGGGGDVLGMIVSEGLEKVKSLAAGFQGEGVIGQIPGAVSEKLGGAVSGRIDKLMETVVNPGGAGAERWRPMIKRALLKQGLAHWANDPAIVNRFVSQVGSESGGDPNISQQIVDINGTGDAAGVGLGQIIPGTFAAYRDPSLPDDRRNPWSNLNAMVRYVSQKYGSQGYMNIGNGIGYDNGGMLPATPGGFGTYFNHTGGPEYVLTDGQWSGIFSAAMATAKLVDPLRELARSMRDLPDTMSVMARDARQRLANGVDAGLSAAGGAVWTALPAPIKSTINQIQAAGETWSAISGYIGSKAEAWARGEWPIGSGRKASENAGPAWMAATLETPLDKVVSTNLNIAQRIANGQEDPGRDPAANAIYDIFGRAPIIPDLQRIAAGGPEQWAYAGAAMMATFETGFTEPMEAFTHETSQLTEAVLRVREAAIAIGDQVKATNDLFTAAGRLPGAAGTAMDRIFGPEGPIQRGLFSFNPAPSAAYAEAIRRIEEQEASRIKADESLEEIVSAEATNTSDAIAQAAKITSETTEASATTTADAVEKVATSAPSTVPSAARSYAALGAAEKPAGPSTWDVASGHLHAQRWTEGFNLIADTLQKDPREIDAEGFDSWEQSTTNAFGEWKRDAFKEITTPFAEPFGLEGFYTKHVDNEYDRLVAVATEAATQVAMRVIAEQRAMRGEDSNKIAENLTVIGTSPDDLAEKVRREQEINLQNQNSRYRG